MALYFAAFIKLSKAKNMRLIFLGNFSMSSNQCIVLNYIPAGVSNNIVFLGLPGKYKIIVQGIVANSEIINSSSHQKKYAELLKLKENFDTRMATEQAPLVEKIEISQSTQSRDSLISIFKRKYREQYSKYYQDAILGFVKHNPDEPASVLELEEYSHKDDRDLTTLSIFI